jgi:peptidyl-prolyl cis-trans isomerase C
MKLLKMGPQNLAVALLALLLMPCIIYAESDNTSDTKVAIVNGNEISDKALEFELKQVKQRFSQQGIKLSEDQTKEVRNKTLNNLIDQELLFQDSRNKGIKIETEAVTERLADLKKRFPTEADFGKTLQNVGLTEADLRKKIARGLAIEELINSQITDKIVISDEENKTFYDKHPEFFKKPGQIRASHILIKVDPKADDTQKALAKQKIKTLQQKLDNGEDFGALAKEYSEGPSNVKNGDLGYFGRGRMVKPFEDAAFALKSGEISGVVETQFGYHLIKVTDKQPETTVAYEDVKQKITQHLKQEKSKTEVEAYIKKLRTSAKIETFL